MAFETITEQDRMALLASNVVARDREIFGYQVNIDNYTAMLAALPAGEWPIGIAQYKGASIESLPAELSDVDVQLVADYAYRDKIRQLLRSEQVEQGKSKRVLAALKSQIPVAQYDALMTAAVAATLV